MIQYRIISGKQKIMPPYAESVYWLTFINESGLKLSRLKPIIHRWCVVEQRPLSALFDLPPLDWSVTFGLTDSETARIQGLPSKLGQYARRLSGWQKQNIETIIRSDSRYPDRLAHFLPPIQQPLMLWARGNLDLLQEPGVAILGNLADKTGEGDFLPNLTAALAAENISLIGGYARGLDRTACDAMLNIARGHVVVVLPMGVGAFTKTTSKLQPALESGQAVLVSPFAPDSAYNEKFAKARTILIDHLALALLIPQADETVVERATAALNRNTPIFVGLTDSPTDSHRALLEAGAYLLTDPGEVIEMVQQAIIDATLQEQNGIPALAPSGAAPPRDPDDDYAIRVDDIGLIDSNEALEILSLGGEIPDILRQRLQKPEDNK